MAGLQTGDWSSSTVISSTSSRRKSHTGRSERESHELNSYPGNDDGPYFDILGGSEARRQAEEFVDWDGSEDPQNPFNWTKRKKWMITVMACFMTLVVQVNGTEMTSAAEQINDEFGLSDEHFPTSYWPILSWTLGGAAAPMLALPLMENFGIRWSYISVYLALIIFLVPQAVARSFATLIITRVITGSCSGVLANITSSIVSDLWRDGRSKSFATSLWIFNLLAGVSLGPVLGSATLKYLSWRWIFYTEIIFYSAFIPLLLFTLPEVRPDVILTRRAERIRSITGKPVFAKAERSHTSFLDVIAKTLIRPSRMLVTEPVVLSFGLWSAFCVGIAFMFTQSIFQVYHALYQWTYFEAGVVQAAIVIGELLGLMASILGDHFYFLSAARNNEEPGHPIPEARLYLSIPGSFVGLAGGLFWYAWASSANVPWILPTLGLGFVGFGMFIAVTAVTQYILDSYAKYAASAIAGVAFLENTLAAFLPLATQSMYTNLGFHWASSLLGFFALVLSCIPLVLLAYGRSIRARSPFMLQVMYDDA